MYNRVLWNIFFLILLSLVYFYCSNSGVPKKGNKRWKTVTYLMSLVVLFKLGTPLTLFCSTNYNNKRLVGWDKNSDAQNNPAISNKLIFYWSNYSTGRCAFVSCIFSIFWRKNSNQKALDCCKINKGATTTKNSF